MPDENKCQQDLDWYAAECARTGQVYNDQRAEDFSMSVANRDIEGGQDETTARQQQFEAMQCTK